MHHHFNLKSLAFYGVAISSVLLLFKVVTAYGESTLKAPPEINSQYRLVFKNNLPICEKTNAPILNIQQSGIYLNGYLLPVTANIDNSTVNHTTSSLSGKFSEQKLNLSGKVLRYILCNTSDSPTKVNTSKPNNNSFSSVRIKIQLVDKGDLTGEINVGGSAKTIGLLAIPQKPNKKSENTIH